MNEEPKNVLPKSWAAPRWVKAMLKMAVIIYPIAFVVFILTAHLSGWSDWLPALLFVLGFSILLSALLIGLWNTFCWLCHWRNLRRVLFVVVCVITVIALFYAEEDWRGRHVWDQFERAEAARGNHFDLAGLIPPPVPDEQNFAMAPVVASSYGQILDRTGHEIRPHNANVVNRLAMDYYGQDFSGNFKLSDWTRGKPTDLAALQHYYQSETTKTNFFPVPAQPHSPAVDVLLALSRYDQTIEELRQASQLPLSRFPLEYDKEEPWDILLPHLGALKRCAVTLCVRTSAEVQAGQGQPALADVKLLLRLANSIRNEPFIISHLVRASMIELTLQPVWEGLADHCWTDTQLVELDAELSNLDFLADYKIGMHGDTVWTIKSLDDLRRHPDQYLRLNEDFQTNLRVNSRSDFTMTLLADCHLIPSGWFYQNQLRYIRIIEQYYAPAVAVPAHTYSPALARQGDAAIEREYQHLSPYNIVACISFSWFNQFDVAKSFTHGQSSVDLARVAIALERCRLAQGKYPASLETLAPQFMSSMPHDVIGGQPLHYRLTDDGQFVLYSVGWNETDDGGVVVLTKGPDSTPDFSRGDWVWRYPSK